MYFQGERIKVKSEREFILGIVRMGLSILIASLIISIGVTSLVTAQYEQPIRMDALRTATFLPMLIVPICIGLVGCRNFKDHRHMLAVTRLAHTDEMTGLANRRLFTAEATEQIQAQDFEANGLCVLIIDLDHFKSINDRYGHSAGDDTLIHISRRMRDLLPKDALIARLGGEEFAVMMPFGSFEDLHGMAESLRQGVARSTCRSGRNLISVTISVGIGIVAADDTVSSVMSRADIALYEAKAQGRNRFAIAA